MGLSSLISVHQWFRSRVQINQIFNIDIDIEIFEKSILILLCKVSNILLDFGNILAIYCHQYFNIDIDINIAAR